MKVGTSVVGVDAPGVVVLTYDDGPTPGVTGLLLEELAAAGASATFFILISRLRRYRGLVADIAAAGHEIGLHGLDHRRMTEVPRREIGSLLVRGRDELEDHVGARVRWFRPPYGAQTRASWQAAVAAGLTPVMWSVQMYDWLTLAPGEHLANVQGRSLAGDVVLLHDGFAGAEDGADDGPPPELDRHALTRGVLGEIAAQDLVARSLGAALVDAAPRMEVRLADGRLIRARGALRRRIR